MPAKTAPNGFAPIVPEVDVLGRTAEEFLSHLFELEFCPECLRDADSHTAVIGPFGAWHAYCDADDVESSALKPGPATPPTCSF
jgi:hypothetical protein